VIEVVRRLDRLAHGNPLILLLVGGDKSTQQQDIDQAHDLAEQWRQEHETEGRQ
jgi:putative component of toxin-antitoxin plasmid stabilization module